MNEYTEQQHAFVDRLSQISEVRRGLRQPVEAPGLVYADRSNSQSAADGMNPVTQQLKEELNELDRRAGRALINTAYPLTIIGAFVVGCLTVMLARWVRLSIFGIDELASGFTIQLGVELVMIAALIFVIANMFRMERPEFLAAKANGALIMVFGMHNLVHLNPGFFAAVFSPEWVDQILTSTAFRTIAVQGHSFAF